MKTRQEMIYDFMLAFASNAEYITDYFQDPQEPIINPRVIGEALFHAAAGAADVYLKEQA
jgi:hypothetical protein